MSWQEWMFKAESVIFNLVEADESTMASQASHPNSLKHEEPWKYQALQSLHEESQLFSKKLK